MSDLAKSLNFSPIVFVGQIVLFLILLKVLDALFWKPILAHIAGRDREIDDRYKRREELQHEMETLRADYLARIAVVEAEARAHIQQAIKEAQAERERLIAEARAEGEAAIQRNMAEIEREKAESLQALRERMVEIAVNVADAALASTADKTVLRRAAETRILGSIKDGASPA